MGKLRATVVLFYDNDEDGGYSVIIPTVPQLATMGKTVEHAFVMAEECLEISLEGPADWDYYNLDHIYAERVVVGTVEIEAPPRPEPGKSNGDAVTLTKVTVVLFHNDEVGAYTAITPSFPHNPPQGETVEQAMFAVKESLAMNLQDLEEWDLFNLGDAYAEHIVVGTVEIDVPNAKVLLAEEDKERKIKKG